VNLRVRSARLAPVVAALCCVGLVAASDVAMAGHWTGEIELPILEVREIRPQGGMTERSLAKFEVEHISEVSGGQVVLKLEHEADIALDRDDDAVHETKLELDRRLVPSQGGRWEKFVRGAFTAAGSLDDSIGEVDRFDLMAGVRLRHANGQARSSIELRLARRHDFNDSAQAWVPGMKLKWSKPVRKQWSVAAEAKLNAVLGSPKPNRVSGKLQLYVLRSFGPKNPLKIGLMSFASGAADSRESTLRAGVGPVITATW
jgi:hypothetical protein